jgi:hypothetical protein
VRCTYAAHDGGKDVDFCTLLVLANGIGEEGVFSFAIHLRCVGQIIVVRAVFIFPYLNLFNRGVTAATVCVADEFRVEKSDEVGFVCRGSRRGGWHGKR